MKRPRRPWRRRREGASGRPPARLAQRQNMLFVSRALRPAHRGNRRGDLIGQARPPLAGRSMAASLVTAPGSPIATRHCFVFESLILPVTGLPNYLRPLRRGGRGVPPKAGERSRPLRHPGGCHPLSVARCCATTALSPSPRPCVRRAPLRRWRPLTAGEPPRRLHHAAHGGGYAPPLPHCLLLRGRPRAAAFAASPVGRRPRRGASAPAAAPAVPAPLRLACAHRLPWGRGAAVREPTPAAR